MAEGKKGARRVVKLTNLDELEPFLAAYASLISGLREMDGRKHTEVVAAYQSDMSAIYRKEATDLVETLKTTRLIKRGSDEKSYRIAAHRIATINSGSICIVERING